MPTQRFPTFTCFLIFLFAVSSYSQEPRIKKVFTNVDHTPITAVAQDKQGNIWYGSALGGIGLTRYDGKEFKSIGNKAGETNSPGSNDIVSILIDTMNVMWIGLGNAGIDRYDMATNRFTHYRHNEKDPFSISSDTISILLQDHTGDIWVGTNKGLSRLDKKTGRFTRYVNEPGVATSLSYNHVRSLYEDKQGTIWVGCGFPFLYRETEEDGGLNKFDRKTGMFTRYKSIPGDTTSLYNNKVSALFEDSKGNFWVGTAGEGLHIMDRTNGTFQRFPTSPKNPQQIRRPPLSDNPVDQILFITEDPRGGIWISTMMGGINQYDPHTKKTDTYGKSVSPDFRSDTSIDSKKRLDDQMFWKAFKSADNSLWFSSATGNVFNLNFNYTSIPFYDDGNAEAYTFYVDSVSKTQWVGTNKGLMQESANGRLLKTFRYDAKDPFSICFNQIPAMRPDKQGRLWLAATIGLSCFDPATGSATNYLNSPNDTNSLNGNYIRTLVFDSQDRLWIGGNFNFQRLDNDKGVFKHYMHSDADTNSIEANVDVYAVLPDNTSGHMWLATDKGVDMLDPVSDHFTHYLKGIFCRAVFIDHEGVTWAGGNNILYRMKPGEKKFSVFEFPFYDSQAEDVILHIMEDNQHNLWLGTRFYLLQINANRTTAKRYGAAFGIPESKFAWGINYKAPDGKLFFGYPNGHYAFYPDQLPADVSPGPTLTFTTLRLNEKEILPGESSVLRLPLWALNDIALSYDQNVFSLGFISQNYISETPNRYYYKLENYDNNWHSLGTSHTAIFINIPPGEYVCHARVVTDEGYTAEKTIRITIAPPWWKTKWAYAIYTLIFLVLAFIANRMIRRRVIENERARSREKELEQAREIEKAYTELKTTQAQLIQSEKMASLGQLTAGIAHEIQNPLNFVNNFSEINSELLADMVTEMEQENYRELKPLLLDIIANEQKIHHHGKRADSIVKGMLQHSRTSTGQKELTDINSLADEYLRLAYHGMRARNKSFNATIETDFDPSIGSINIAAQDISRVLLNLYNNAFDAMNEKMKAATTGYEPVVRVQSRKKGNNVDIIITDNGNGVPAAIIDKIFQPFFTTKPTGQGTGLGLSLSYDIVKANNGTLKVDSVAGKYSTFTVSLTV